MISNTFCDRSPPVEKVRLALWGALKKIPQRLLEALRYYLLAEADFDVRIAARCHIGLNSS